MVYHGRSQQLTVLAENMNPYSETARLVRVLLAYFILFGVFAVASLLVPIGDNFLIPCLSAWIGACVGIALVYNFSRGPDDNWTLWKLIAGGMALDLLCNFTALGLVFDNPALR